MAEKRRDVQQKQPYELFDEVMLGPLEGVETPEYQPSAGDRFARESMPVVNETEVERRRREEKLKEETPGLVEGVDMATKEEWPIRMMGGGGDAAPNPDFEMSTDALMERSEGLPDDAIDYIGDARSTAQADQREQQYRENYKRRQELGKLGWTGVGLQVGAAMTSPTAWGVGAGANAMFGPAGLIGTAVNRTNRARRVIQSAVAGGTANLGVESILAANKPIYDNMNLLYATGLGAGLAGGFSALSRNPATQAEAEGLRNVGEGLQREATEETVRVTEDSLNFNVKSGKPFASEMSVKNSKRFRETPNAEAVQIREGEWGWRVKPDPSQEGDAGAALHSRQDDIRYDISVDNFEKAVKEDPWVAPTAAMAKARFSSMAYGLSSDSEANRAVFKPLAEEGVGYTDRNAPVAMSASERQKMREQTDMATWTKNAQINFREWLKDQSKDGKWKPFYQDEMRNIFFRQVTDAIEEVGDDVHPSVARQAEVGRKIYGDFAGDLNQPMAYRQEFGKPVRGWGTKEKERTYSPHEFDLQNIRKLVAEFGDVNVRSLIAKAAREVNEDLTEAQAQAMAEGYLKVARSIDAGMGMDTARILSRGDSEEIKDFLKGNASGDDLSEADIDDIVDKLSARKPKNEGSQKHSKSRTALNMKAKKYMKRSREAGVGGREVDIRELFQRDADELISRYVRRMSGSLAMARYRIPGLSDGISSHGEWQTLMDKAREYNTRHGLDPADTNRELAEADKMYRAIMGMPNEADLTQWGQALKFFRDWSFLRFMGQVGFAQVPEMGVVASGLGIKATMQSVPGYRTLMRDAKTGKIDNEVVDELETMLGLGADWSRSWQQERFNDMTGAQDTFFGKGLMDKVEMGMRKSKRAVFAGSGMAPINTMMKRMAGNGIANKFAHSAWGTGKGINKNRLRSIGLDEVQVDRILDNINRFSDSKTGLTGRQLKRLNIAKWDLKAEADFSEAVFRYTNRLVQENDIGQFRQWMAHPVARMFLQFRSFIIGAHEKQFLHNLHMRDLQSFTTFATTTLMATLGYTAMTYSRSVGKENQEEYLEERLNMKELAKASFERSSWSGLVPSAIDTAFPGTFQYSRSSGQSVSAQFGNPTFDTADSGVNALRTIFGGDAARSQEDMQNILRLAPFQNLNGVTQMTNVLMGETGLPEDAPRD